MDFKKFILVIAIVVVVIGAASFLISNQAHPKQDSKVIMTSADNLTEGDNFTVKLTDLNNTPLSNQNISVTIVSGKDGSVQKNLTTDANGEAGFELNDSATGSCAVKVKYAGNEKFNGCNMTKNIVINKKVVIQIPTNSTNILANNTTGSQVQTVEDSYSNYNYNYNNHKQQSDVVTYEDSYYN